MSAWQANELQIPTKAEIFFKFWTDTTNFVPASYYDNLPMTKIDKLKDKFKNVSAVTFTTHGDELMVCFSGFEEEDDAKEFADFLFAKIKMRYSNNDDIPVFH